MIKNIESRVIKREFEKRVNRGLPLWRGKRSFIVRNESRINFVPNVSSNNFTTNALNACRSNNEPLCWKIGDKRKDMEEGEYRSANVRIKKETRPGYPRQPNPDIPRPAFLNASPDNLRSVWRSVPSIFPSFLALRSRQEALIIDVRLHSRSQIFSSLLKVILHLAAWHGWKLTRVTRGSWSGLLGRCRGCCKRVSVLFRY